MRQTVSSVRIQRILIELKRDGSVARERPRCVGANAMAIVAIETLDGPLCLETYAALRSMGRFALRSGDVTVAAGIVQKV